MAIYYAQEIFERTSARASALRNEAGALLLSCSGGNMTRLGGEDWEPPLALELTGVHARHQEGWHDYMGVYKLESREVNGKPCWRHAERSDLWLAFDGVGWAAQPEDRLGDRFGWLQLRDAGPLHMSKCMWQAAPDDASRWLTQPDLKCRLVSAASVRRGISGSGAASESRRYLERPCDARRPSEPPPVRLRDSVESLPAGADVRPPSIGPPKAEYVQKAKGMTTSL